MADTILFISPQTLEYGITPTQNVMVKLDYEAVGDSQFLIGDLKLALELTPTEAREVAAALVRTADAVEAAGPRSIQ
jgi:hypothetical protein